MTRIRIWHDPSDTLLAEGPEGWTGITRFEGNLYIRRKHLATDAFRPNYIPGLCPYKGLYVWLDLRLPDQSPARGLGWLYWLPNPLLPFIAFRVGLPRSHPALRVELVDDETRSAAGHYIE